MACRIAFLSALLVLGSASVLHAGFANEYAVFGGQSLTLEGFAKITGGPAGSNGDVSHLGGIAYFDALYGGGTLNPTPPTAWNARQHVTGDVIFNSSVNINALSNIGGSLHSGGAVSIGANAGPKGVGGDIIAAGAVNILHYNQIGGSILAGSHTILGDGVKVARNIGANGNVALGLGSHVTGLVTHSGTFSMNAFSSVGGDIVGTVNPQPAAFTPVSLPPATAFDSGGATLDLPVFADQTLSPGSYGDLVFRGSNTLRLSAGNYFFDSIASPGTFLNLHLDLTQGPINVFVAGDVQFKRVRAFVNGANSSDVPAALAGDMFLESHGNIVMEGYFFGSMYAPYGDVTTGTIGAVTGSIIAARDLVIGSATNIDDGLTTFVPSKYLAARVPEPASTLLLLLCAPLLLRPRPTR